MPEFSHDEQLSLTRLVLNVLDSWGVGNADKIVLLALPADTKPRNLQRYQDDTPLPFDSDIYERVEHLVGISESLHLANPRSEQAGVMWLKRPNRRFHGRSPLTVMIADGLFGITQVRKQLDCSYDWYVDEQQSRSKP
jgi:hypothetical protein